MRHLLPLLTRRHFQKLIILLAIDIGLLCSTNARQAAAVVLIAGFVLILFTFYYLFYELVALAKFYGAKIYHPKKLALSLTAVMGCLIALQSVGELSFKDAAVLLPIGLIGYIYSSYGANKRDQLL